MKTSGVKWSRVVAATALSYLAFIGTWVLAIALSEALRSNWAYLSAFFYYGVCASVAGIMVPLYLADQFGFVFHEPASRRRLLAGTAVLLVGLVVAIAAFGAPLASHPRPPFEVTARYLLLSLPVGLGLCVQAFFLIPRSVETVFQGKPIASVAAVIISATAFTLGVAAGGLLADPTQIVAIAALSVLLATGVVLTRSVYLTFPVLLVVLSTNSLTVVLRNNEEPWGALIAGFAVFVAALAYALVSREPRQSLMR